MIAIEELRKFCKGEPAALDVSAEATVRLEDGSLRKATAQRPLIKIDFDGRESIVAEVLMSGPAQRR